MNWNELVAECGATTTVERPRTEAAGAYVIGAMGGSGLAARALQYFAVPEPFILHQDYGVPTAAPKNALYIALSYSGTTEETVSFANEALKAGKSVAVIASGGILAELATRERLPFVRVPAGYPPRYAFMYLVRALLTLCNKDALLEEIAGVVPEQSSITTAAEEDAKALVERVPVFYASSRNALLAHFAKLVMNESAHLPAFMHLFPEMNHEELESYDTDIPEGLEHLFLPIMFSDDGDDARITRRMDLFESVLGEHGRSTRRIHTTGASRSKQLIETWLRLIAVAESLAAVRNIDPSNAPMVAAFKKLL